MTSEPLAFATYAGLVGFFAASWAGYFYYRRRLGMKSGRLEPCVVAVLGVTVIAWAVVRVALPPPVVVGGSPFDAMGFIGHVFMLISGLLGLTFFFYCTVRARGELAKQLPSNNKNLVNTPSTRIPDWQVVKLTPVINCLSAMRDRPTRCNDTTSRQ